MYPCIKCGFEVRTRQHAISCDVCNNWQHRKCDTGITHQQYMDARKERIILNFVCMPCMNGNRSSVSSILDEEDVEDRDAIQEVEAEDEMEDDRDEIQPDLDSSFDIGHRIIQPQQETLKMSIAEADLPETLYAEEEVYYELLPTGSKRGAPLLLSSDGFSYGVKTKKQARTQWRCSVRAKTNPCLATVAQDGDTFIRNQHKHNHPGDPAIKIKKKVYAKAKESAQEQIFKPATEIVEETLIATVTDETAFLKPKNATVKRIVNKHRAKSRPETPKELNFEINTDFLHIDEFLIGDVNMECCRLIVFSTPFQLNLLQQARRWFIDGTFKIVGQPFRPNGQLMSINAFVQQDGEKKQFPLVFALMSRRRKSDYVAVLRTVIARLNEPLVDSFVLDFETAAWQAINEVFPGKEIKGCVFHWSQAVYRQIQQIGLSTPYMQQGPVRVYLRQLLALPFLPADHILDSFMVLKLKANEDKLKQLVAYMDHQWMRHPVFTVESWSVFERTVRTNNDVEAWHRRLNCRGSGLSFYKLVPVLIGEADMVRINVQGGDFQRRERDRTKKISQKLEEAWAEYRTNRLTSSRFLKICGSIYHI